MSDFCTKHQRFHTELGWHKSCKRPIKPSHPKKGGKKPDHLYEILFDFAQNFAQKPVKDGRLKFGWWGHDTDLGDCEDAFKEAHKKIYELFRRQP